MDLKQMYADKTKTAEQIAASIESGWSCSSDISGAIPTVLADALGKRAAAGEVKDLVYHSLLDITPLGRSSRRSAGFPVAACVKPLAKAAAISCPAITGMHRAFLNGTSK